MSYSLPQYAPLFDSPPYAYRGSRKLSVVCRADRAALQAALPASLTLASDLIEVFALDVPDAGALGSYREGGIVVNVSYQGQSGGHVLYEYVTTDDSLCAGREIWGYPKKLCEMDWFEGEASEVSASVMRRGKELIAIRFSASGPEYPPLDLQPRYQVKRIPSADGAGNDFDRVIRNELGGGTIHKRVTGSATVRLGSSVQDPLAELGITEVIGAEFIVADFMLGFGKILD